MRCAACSALLPDTARICTHCGATVYPSERMTLLTELGGPEPASPKPVSRLKRQALWGVGLAAVALALAVGAVAWAGWPSSWHGWAPRATAEKLQTAMARSLALGGGPGVEPVCIANGLPYDRELVHVRSSNNATVVWMDALVRVGLYAAEPEALAQTEDGTPLQVYKPLPALDGWGSERRLCMARSVRLLTVRNLSEPHAMRFRGEAYQGVAADVVWAPDQPAPWLASPAQAAALALQWPAWRGARWTNGEQGWTLVQRRHFFLHDGQWLTAESLEQVSQLPRRPGGPLF